MAKRFKKGNRIIPRANRYPVGVLEVLDHCSHCLEAFPTGGGPHLRFTPDKQRKYEFRLVEPWERAEWKPGLFCLDDDPDHKFPGFWNGHRWNGWAMPAFDAETVRAIFRMLNEAGTYSVTDDGSESPTFIVRMDFDGGYTFPMEPEMRPEIANIANGELRPVYFFSGWTWTEAEPEPADRKDVLDQE